MDITTNYALKKPAYTDGADVSVLNDNADAIDAALKVNKDIAGSAVQSATFGGVAVPKSGQQLQIPLPTSTQIGLGNVSNTADSAKSVNYANTAGSAPANGGTANYAHYSSHAVGSGGAALRNITMSTAGPSGGSDGDVWHQYS